MMRNSSVKTLRSWIILFAWVGFIYATLGTVPDWRDYLVEHYGDEIFTTITLAAGSIALIVFLVTMIFRRKERKPLPYFALFAVLGFLFYVMKHWVTLPVEQIHFVEYGMVGFLAFGALKQHLRGWGLAAAAILLTFLFGMVDETIQGLLVNRVGEQRDMYLNGLAGAMSLTILAFSIKSTAIWRGSGRREFRALLLMFAVCLLVQGYFCTKISQFGYLIHDEALNLIIKSRLKPEELITYSDHLQHFKTEIAPHVGKTRMANLMPKVHNLIHEEALVHAFRRAYHFRLGNIRTVYTEDLIINKYYKRFVEGTSLDWPRDLSDQMRFVVGTRFEVLYHSIVAGHLITRFSALQMWSVIIALEIILFISIFLIRHKTDLNPLT